MRSSYIILSLLSLAFTACFTANKGEKPSNNISKPMQKAILGEAPKDNPSTQINSAKILGNILELEVSFSGGCEEQVFDLVGSEMIMKSFPPQRSVVLVRDSKGDNCREWVTKKLVFDITELHHNKQKDAEIILRLEGFEEGLRYTFFE